MRFAVLVCLLAELAFAQSATVSQLFQSAVQAQQRGDLDAAIRDYQRVTELQPKFFDAEVNLAVALVHRGRFDEAIRYYREALQLQPSNAAVRLNLGLAYYKKNDPADAAAIFAALWKEQPGDTRTATLLGDCYLQLGRNEEAISLLQPLSAGHPGDLDMAYVLGSALINMRRWHDGAVILERVGKQGNSADAYLSAGKAFLELRDYASARENLEGAMRLNPNLPGLYRFLGITKEASGDDKGAEADLRKALEADPNDFQANLHLGGILYSHRDLDQARIYIDHARKADPHSVFPVYETALLNSEQGKLEAAATDLEKVIQADPNWLEPHVKLAALYYKLHRPADGMRERQTVDRLTAEQNQTANPKP